MPPRPPRLRIEYIALEELRAWDENPKLHDPDLAISIQRFGFLAPMGINETTGTLLYGAGRREKLIERFQAHQPPPRYVQVRERDGAWMVPVIRGIELADPEAKAYAIADNRLSERGGWDSIALLEAFDALAAEQISFEGLGFEPEDFDRLAEEAEKVRRIFSVSEDEVHGGEKPAKIMTCPQCGHKWEV